MTAYPKMTAEERKAEYAEVTREYEELKARGLNLNMVPSALVAQVMVGLP